jgi:VWFA-related protein
VVRRISFVIVAALATVSLTAQNRQNQPTFRSGAAYVRVDMYATRDGKPIEDIQANEVEILEDGVPQQVEAFEHVRVRTGIPQELRVEPKGVEESRQMAGDPRARVFVIFLDTYHTQVEGSATMRQPLMNFIDRVLGPDDMVAVMTPEMAATEVTFQRKTTVISKMLEREWLWGRRGRLPGADNDEKENLYDACYPDLRETAGIAKEMKARRREKLTLDALEDLMIHLNGIREERKALLAVTEGWRLYRPDTKLARDLGDAGLKPGDFLLRPPRPSPSDTSQLQGSPRVQCEADRMALAMLDHEHRLEYLTQDANRGNVTFYPVFARGLVAFDAPIGPERPPNVIEDAAILRARQDTLRALAADTDGTAVINTNNIDGALRRIVDDLSSYYLMGYYTTNTKLDGRFRSITVRVKRPGTTVRARKGYRGYTTEELARGGVTPAALGATGGSSSAAPATVTPPAVNFSARAQFRIRAAAWSRAGLTGGTVWIVGELDQQTKRLPAWTRGAQAEIAVTGADNAQVAQQRLELKPGESTFVLQLPDAGGMQSGDYTVRARLRSPVEGELGLIDTARITVKSPPSLGDAVLWRRGPSTGPQHLRTADPRFQRNERIRLELPTSMTEPATARVVDRNGQTMSVPVEVSTRPDAAGFTWVVVDLGLAPFGPADYAIEVTQGQMMQMTAFRVVP